LEVGSQWGQVVRETLSRKTLHKKWLLEWLEVEGPEFKPQYCKNFKKEEEKSKFFLTLPCKNLLTSVPLCDRK
jgi:hypothetical protein